jgi:type I restriction enzyme R subunit
LTAKTRELLQEHIESGRFELPCAIQELNANTLKKAHESKMSDTMKVLNLRKLLQKKVTDESRSKPFLISIGERAEEITEAYENRQLTTQQVLLEFGELAVGFERASIERIQMDLDENAYAVYTVLKTVTEKITAEQARALNGVFGEFPDYQWDEHQRSQLRAKFYRILISIIETTSDRIQVANALLDLKRI